MAHKRICTIAIISLFLLPLHHAHAISMRHDIPDSQYLVDSSSYPALVGLHSEQSERDQWGHCMSTLIAPAVLLTVAHCANDFVNDKKWKGKPIMISGIPHEIQQVVLHPDWSEDKDENDIAIIRLVTPLPPGSRLLNVSPLTIYTGRDEKPGDKILIVGSGIHSTGLQGEKKGTNDGKLRQATNTLQKVTDQFLTVRFRKPTDHGVSRLEGVGNSGDSGGPVFNEQGQIVGINATTPESDSRVGKYGAQDWQIRVSSFLEFIASHAKD
jgi:secreted trypsin-like serine protease